MSLTRMLIFLSVVLAIVGGLHLYFWMRLVRDTALPFPYRTWAGAALVALAASLPLTFVLGRRLAPQTAALLAWPAFTWMGLMFLLLVLLVGADLVRLALWLAERVTGGEPADPSRRLLLARALGAGAGATAGVIGAVAVREALRRLEVRTVEVTLSKLGAPGDGTTIVQLTDVHVGPTIGRAFIEHMVRITNEQNPDVVAITGDLVDGSVAELRHAVEPLKDLRARHGVYFVTGNHEYFSGAPAWIAELGRLGIRVLRNEHVTIGSGEGAFDLAGVDDHSAGRFMDGHGPDVERAVAGRDGVRPLVLLAHQPRTVELAARAGVDLQLSGHTHGGQIWPFSYLVKLQQPYVVGLAQHEQTQIYVSPGTGYWGPPLRLGTRAEVTRVVLRSRRSSTDAA